MVMNKRGISAVVATILIILIVVASVTILWSTVIPMLQEQSSFGEELVDLTIERAEGYTVYDDSTKKMTVQVSRGGDDENLVGVQFIFSKAGDSENYISDIVPEKNQKKTYKFDLIDFGESDSISIAGVFDNNKVGSVTSKVDDLPRGDLSAVEGSFINPVQSVCAVVGDCSDRICKIKSCDAGSCVYTNMADGSSCDDGDANTEDDICTAGVCEGTPIVTGTCVDLDGDGYGSPASATCTYPELDCLDDPLDGGAEINPGVAEICDGRDNNCDGTIDEGCEGICDTDNDGHDEFFWCLGGGPNDDCNDNDATIYPDAPELCDGKDNQCSGDAGYGTIDEGCSCSGDAMATCNAYDGMKNVIGTSCADAGCSAYEKWCGEGVSAEFYGADMTKDGSVGPADYSRWYDNFQDTGCNYAAWATGDGAGSDWCNNADATQDGSVGPADYSVYYSNSGDTGCNLPENIYIDCYTTATCDGADMTSCQAVTGCSWA